MNDRTDTYTDKHIRGNLFCGGNDLLPRILYSIPEMQFLLRDIQRTSGSDVFLHLIFKVQLLNQRAAGNRNHKAEHNIDDGNLPPENAHQQDKASEVDHRGGDEK